jgi:hypothetical protein
MVRSRTATVAVNGVVFSFSPNRNRRLRLDRNSCCGSEIIHAVELFYKGCCRDMHMLPSFQNLIKVLFPPFYNSLFFSKYKPSRSGP